jgi:hypothetical protein
MTAVPRGSTWLLAGLIALSVTRLPTAVALTIIDLQPFRQAGSTAFPIAGGRGMATLVNLNPHVNAWFVLTLTSADAAQSVSFHLENPFPETQSLALNADHPFGLQITVNSRTSQCDLWTDGTPTPLQQARATELPYAPLCEDHLYVRNAVSGTYTHLERVTGFLRGHVWGGDRIVGFVRRTFFSDAFVETSAGGEGSTQSTGPIPASDGPAAARIAEPFAARVVIPEHLGIDVGQQSGGLLPGQWYAARGAPGIFVSAIQPQGIVEPTAMGRPHVNSIDAIEAAAVDYMVALDLGQFDLGFSLGTDHPRVGWSERALDSIKDPKLPGPDGIGSVAPLVVNGMVNPAKVAHVAATFAGGFKREHGAFRYGRLAQQNRGSHYGFIEQGVVFSKLQPELATLYVNDDGGVQMKTWASDDDVRLADIKHARQNGVPLIEYDARTGTSRPGELVNSWGPGNWSGSDDEHLRTVRAGVCLVEKDTRRYLVYGYFSTATPSAMVRVFQAYGCRYAMHLDMNALEHTYMAIYTQSGGRIVVQHLIEGMEEVDRKGGGELAPRFLSFPDDRDFFYLTRKGPP